LHRDSELFRHLSRQRSFASLAGANQNLNATRFARHPLEQSTENIAIKCQTD
jgi:hypothetical protein